jgi:hypothetical protein
VAWPETEIEGVSIVVKGAFNPALFSPAWMLSEQLVGKAEYDKINIDVITQGIASFSMAWLQVTVTQDTFQVQTQDRDEFERARDVAIGVLKSLPHVPVAALGINRDVHFSVESYEDLNRIGDALAPKEIWKNSLRLPGLRDLTVWAVREDLFAGHVQVAVQPSNSVPIGLFIAHNDHFDLYDVEVQPNDRSKPMFSMGIGEASAEKNGIAVRMLSESWSQSMARAVSVFETVARVGRRA